jgi:hypothetical protein
VRDAIEAAVACKNISVIVPRSSFELCNLRMQVSRESDTPVHSAIMKSRAVCDFRTANCPLLQKERENEQLRDNTTYRSLFRVVS